MMENFVDEVVRTLLNASSGDWENVPGTSYLNKNDISQLVNALLRPNETRAEMSASNSEKTAKQAAPPPSNVPTSLYVQFPQPCASSSQLKETCASCKVDIREMESYIAVYVDLPGVQKNCIHLALAADNTLVLEAERTPYNISSDTFLLKERHMGVIKRSIKLPKQVDSNSMSARYSDGVLFVKLNKLGPSTEVKKIAIE